MYHLYYEPERRSVICVPGQDSYEGWEWKHVIIHIGRAGGTNSNLIFTKHKFVMVDFLMSALCRLSDNVIIFPIGGVKVVFLNICLFSP